MSVDIYRGTRICILGDSETLGHNVGSSVIVSWQKALRDIFEARYGADRPILRNGGTNGDGFVSSNTHFTINCAPFVSDVVFAPIMTNEFASNTGTLTTNINTYLTTLTTAANYRVGKVPRGILCIGAMCSSGVFSEDWSQESPASAFAVRNAIYAARAAAFGLSYADPLSLWLQIERYGKPVTTYGTTVDANGVASQYQISTLSPINPSHTSIPANGTGYTGDGTHTTINGSRVWSTVAAQQLVFRDSWEPGL